MENEFDEIIIISMSNGYFFIENSKTNSILEIPVATLKRLKFLSIFDIIEYLRKKVSNKKEITVQLTSEVSKTFDIIVQYHNL